MSLKMGNLTKKILAKRRGFMLIGFILLSDAVHRADKLLISQDGTTGHQIEDEGNSWQDCRPYGTERDRSPGFVANGLSDYEITDIPAHHQQGIEKAEKSLYLAIPI
jgi:hypothetical protein